jgi:hypothetical protein
VVTAEARQGAAHQEDFTRAIVRAGVVFQIDVPDLAMERPRAFTASGSSATTFLHEK